MSAQEKYNKLKEILSGYGRLLIAYSGGVDSTFLVKAAFDVLGKNKVIACIAKGPSLPQSQYERAVESAETIGVELITIQADEMSDNNYLKNISDRCYHCKSSLFRKLSDTARDNNCDTIACGHNLDDTNDFRPGNKAVKDFDIAAPLIEAGLGKKDIRAISKKLGLPTADIPASPCLASRIAYGQEITREKLLQVEKAEEFLKTFGLTEFRVRHHNEVARIEVKSEDISKLLEKDVKARLIKRLKSLGFKYITLDLEGFRSGSLNEMLTSREKDAYK